MSRRDDEPRWLTELERHGADPLAIYEHTYGAIAGTDVHRRGRRRFGSVLLVVAALLLAALAVRPGTLLWLRRVHLPVHTANAPAPPPPPAPGAGYGPGGIGTTPVRPKADVRIGEER